MQFFKVKKLNSLATLPTRAHPDDAGLDLYSTHAMTVFPNFCAVIKTGISGEFAPGYVGMLADRSSMAKKGFKLAGGIIDSGYTGEITVMLWNISSRPLSVELGDKVAQLLTIPITTPQVMEVTELKDSERGDKGFGSSGA